MSQRARGDEPDDRTRRGLDGCLASLEDEGGILLACARHPPTWERPGPGGPACLAERIGPLAAAVVLEHCDLLG